jgi:Flp pilus assembly pilin Flp
MLKTYVAAKSRLMDFQDHLKSLRDDESGAAMLEYALLIGLLAVGAVTTLGLLGPKVTKAFTDLNTGWK